MAKGYEFISSSIASSGAVGSLSLTSIPSGYASLLLIMSLRSARTNSADDGLKLTFNGETAVTNNNSTFFYGYGNTYSQGYSGESGYLNGDLATANIFSSHEILIPNYTDANTVKPYLAFSTTENNAAGALMDVRAMRWGTSGGAAITRIDIAAATGNNLKQYSSAYLYGIRQS